MNALNCYIIVVLTNALNCYIIVVLTNALSCYIIIVLTNALNCNNHYSSTYKCINCYNQT